MINIAKAGHYILGGGHYDSHSPPPNRNPDSGIVPRITGNNNISVDDLLEPHEGRIRVARGSKVSARILAPDPLELCYLGLQVINHFPDDYPRYLMLLEEYKNIQLLDQETIYGISNMLERNMEKLHKNSEGYTDEQLSGIGAMTESPQSTAQLQPQNQH